MAYRNSYESRGSSAGIGILSGVSIGLMLSIVLTGIFNDPDDRVRDVQLHNQQLLEQLDNDRVVNGLILDDEEDTFTFGTRDRNGVPQECTGTYEVEGDVARVVGDLTCSQTVTVAD